MSFAPLTSSQDISYIRYKSAYRNSARESAWGTAPVFFVPSNYGTSQNGFPGPKYKSGQSYDESTSDVLGNCTWWCYARCQEANGIQITSVVAHDANNWYTNYTGNKSKSISNLKAGDIIVLSDTSAGHVMFVEKISGSTVTISESAYSTRSVWSGKACLVTTYDTSELGVGSSVNIYKNLSSAYYCTVVGFLHTGGSGPTPSEDLEISISPTSYTRTMSGNEEYEDFTFHIEITGIPDGESAQGGNSYPGLDRVYNTGWSYEDYEISGETYRRAYKTQTLRYYREKKSAYTITKHMYFEMTKSTGSIYADTPMYITVDASGAVMFLNPEIGSIEIR